MNYVTLPPDRGADEAAIRALESAYDLAWNAGDLASILRIFTSDVVVTNPAGQTSVGRDGMEHSLASLFAGVGKGSTPASEISGVHFVTADVALVDKARGDGRGPAATHLYIRRGRIHGCRLRCSSSSG